MRQVIEGVVKAININVLDELSSFKSDLWAIVWEPMGSSHVGLHLPYTFEQYHWLLHEFQVLPPCQSLCIVLQHFDRYPLDEPRHSFSTMKCTMTAIDKQDLQVLRYQMSPHESANVSITVKMFGSIGIRFSYNPSVSSMFRPQGIGVANGVKAKRL